MAAFKAHTYNLLAERYRWKRIVDLGCGDGFIIPYIEYEIYVGIDTSKEAIRQCKEVHKQRAGRAFLNMDTEALSQYALKIKKQRSQYDVALSFDVTFHIIDDDEYYWYLEALSFLAEYACIFTVNASETDMEGILKRKSAPHVKHRRAIDKLEEMGMSLIEVIPCPYSAWENTNGNTSFCEMFVLRSER